MKDKIDALREEVMMRRGGVWLWDDVDKAIAQAVAIAQEDKAALEKSVVMSDRVILELQEELEDVVKCGNHFQKEIVRLEQELAKARLGNACIYGTSHPEIYKCGHEQELDELKKKGNEAVTTALDSVIDVVGKMAIGNLQLDNSIGDKMEAQDNVDWDEETLNGCMNRGHNFALKAVEQAIKDMKGKALDIKCDICGKRLDQLGALYFSPPKNNVVVKTHICVSCDKLMNQAIKKMKEG